MPLGICSMPWAGPLCDLVDCPLTSQGSQELDENLRDKRVND